ncbi:MAG: hypothetical protein WCC66_11530 [Rhizobiaceae bacterium]
MTMINRTANYLVSGAVLLALFAAPAFALAQTQNDGQRKISGAGLVLMVSLQRNAG